MPLAIILGLILLSPSSEASIACSMSPMGVDQITPSPLQNSETGNSALQNPSMQPGEQQKSPAQPAQAPQSSVQPCPGNSQPTGTKSDCKPAASKPKKHHQTHKAVAPAATPAPEGPAKNRRPHRQRGGPHSESAPRPEPARGFPPRDLQSIGNDYRCEPAETLRPPTQSRRGRHGKANQELHGAGQGRGEGRRRAARLQPRSQSQFALRRIG